MYLDIFLLIVFFVFLLLIVHINWPEITVQNPGVPNARRSDLNLSVARHRRKGASSSTYRQGRGEARWSPCAPQWARR